MHLIRFLKSLKHIRRKKFVVSMPREVLENLMEILRYAQNDIYAGVTLSVAKGPPGAGIITVITATKY